MRGHTIRPSRSEQSSWSPMRPVEPEAELPQYYKFIYSQLKLNGRFSTILYQFQIQPQIYAAVGTMTQCKIHSSTPQTPVIAQPMLEKGNDLAETHKLAMLTPLFSCHCFAPLFLPLWRIRQGRTHTKMLRTMTGASDNAVYSVYLD